MWNSGAEPGKDIDRLNKFGYVVTGVGKNDVQVESDRARWLHGE